MFRPIPVLALLGALAIPAHAANPCSAACATLVGEAHVLHRQGKLAEALAKYQAASDAAPQASLPMSAAAYVYLDAAAANPAKAGELRGRARALAQAALGKAADDPLAQELLRMLDSDAPSPLHVPNAAAQAVLSEAEALFGQGRHAEALPRYEEAMRLDPQASFAWVGAGDCWFMRKDWERAAALFRRAVEIEPRNAKAWRYLADTLGAQGKAGAAEDALLAAIGADPSMQPSWVKLAQLRARAGLPLKPLHLRRGARVKVGADGKPVIDIDAELQNGSPVPDNAMRLALAVGEANARADKAHPRSPYEIELAAWRLALTAVSEAEANGGAPVSDPALVQMRALDKDGQLEPAILLLLYRESYRPALDAWLQAHPGGVRRFVDRYGLQP